MTDTHPAAPATSDAPVPRGPYTQAQVDALIAAALAEQIPAAVAQALRTAAPRPRRRLPPERPSLTHKFSIGGHEGFITAGTYADGTLGEVFLTDVGKEGSTLRGMMNAFATLLSIALQYGVPLESLVAKFAFVRFEPEGITGNREIPFAKSMPDYILRWLASRFLDGSHHAELGIRAPAATPRGPVGPRPGDAAADELAEGVKSTHPAATAGVGASEAGRAVPSHADGRICRDCGAAMRRTGACETCPSCGQNTGCG